MAAVIEQSTHNALMFIIFTRRNVEFNFFNGVTYKRQIIRLLAADAIEDYKSREYEA